MEQEIAEVSRLRKAVESEDGPSASELCSLTDDPKVRPNTFHYILSGKTKSPGVRTLNSLIRALEAWEKRSIQNKAEAV